jgi:hypothetical protein
MLDDKRYESLNTIVKDIVSKGEDLRAKQMKEQYGETQADSNEPEEINESVVARVRSLYKQIKNRDLLKQHADLKYLYSLESWGEDYWCNIGKFDTPDGRPATAERSGADPKEAAAYCRQHRAEKAKFKKELDEVSAQLESKLGKDWERKYFSQTRKQILDILDGSAASAARYS